MTGEFLLIDHTISTAIDRLENILAGKKYGLSGIQKYQGEECDNGNEFLMRIIPLLFLVKGKPIISVIH